MRIAKYVNAPPAKVRCLAAAAAMTAMALTSSVRAQVLEQVPGDAVGVVKVKDLGALSTKVAHMAKSFGLDEIDPDMKDPLGSMLEKAHISKGVNKSGDAALAIFDNDRQEAAGEPDMVAIVPVSDYGAFLGNFEKSNDNNAGGDITAVKDPDHADKTLYIAHHGNYAVFSDHKAHLNGKINAFKVTGAAKKESDAKDAVFILNVPVIRDKALPQLKKNRAQIIKDMSAQIAQNPQLKEYQGVFGVMANQGLDFAQNFLEDARSIVFSMDLTDDGLAGASVVEFEPDSKFGSAVAKIKPGKGPLLAGLPDRKYFFFGGASFDPDSQSHLAKDFMDPLIKELNNANTDAGKQIADAMQTLSEMFDHVHSSVAGYVVPTKPIGQESMVQMVGVSHGDADVIAKDEKKLLTQTNALTALMQGNSGIKTKLEFNGDPRDIDGVKMQPYLTKIDMDPNDPAALRVQQFMGFVYGPGGLGGEFGAVNAKTFLIVQGGSDELVKEAIDAAKNNKDVLGQTPGVKAVAAHLQPDREMEYYIALDNIIASTVHYAQGFGLGMPFKIKLPQNQPPLAFSAGTEGSSIRVDGFIPAQTVQSLVAAGIQAYTQMQNGGPQGGL